MKIQLNRCYPAPSNQILEACGVYDLATNAAVGNLEYSEAQREISLAESAGNRRGCNG